MVWYRFAAGTLSRALGRLCSMIVDFSGYSLVYLFAYLVFLMIYKTLKHLFDLFW